MHNKICYILVSTPDDLLAIAARARTGRCKRTPKDVPAGRYFEPGRENPRILTCSTSDLLKPKGGNYILYDWLGQNMELPNILTIAQVKDDYCVPRLPACELESLLNNIMDSRIATEVTMAQYIDEIDVWRFGLSATKPTTTPFFVRCQGILKSAMNAGFNYVQYSLLDNEACNTKIEIQSPTGYIDVCDGFVQNDCGFNTIKITKT